MYNTISSDRRHNSVTVVVDRQVQKRDFEKWSMAFRFVLELLVQLSVVLNPMLAVDTEK